MERKQLYLATIDDTAQILAKKYGLGLEIDEFCTAWNLDEFFEETNAAVKEKMKCTDRYILHAPFNELFPCAIDPKARELATSRYLQILQVAKWYKISKIVIHGGYHNKIYYPCWYTEQSILFWRKFLKNVPDGMVLCLENVLEEEPGMIAEIIRTVNDGKLRMCLDVGHANAYSKTSVVDWLHTCADVIEHFHIHSNDGTWDNHEPLGTGTLPMEEFLRSAEACCPQATYTLELAQAEASICWLQQRQLIR